MYKNMKSFIKITLIIAGIFLNTTNITAQIGTTNNNPSPTAALDLTSTLNKGILIPRVSLSSTTDVTTVAAPTTSMLVYNTQAGITGTGALGVGYYYYDGTIWKKLIAFNDTDDNLGNHIATADLNMQANKIAFARADGLKVALTDNVDGPLFSHNGGWVHNTQLGYKTVGAGQAAFSNYSGTGNTTVTERMRLTPKGYLGVGTSSPSAKLEVAGNTQIDQQLTVKQLPAGLTDKIGIIDDNGLVKRASIDLTGLPKRYDYKISNLKNGDIASTTIVDLPVYMLSIVTSNGCGRTGIASFTVCGNTLSYLGGQARDKIYTVTPVGTTGSSYKLYADIVTCQDGNGSYAFNYTVSISGNTVTVQCNANADSVSHSYDILVLDY
jgi:hypothetical protein